MALPRGDSEITEKVPLLGDVPLLGLQFRRDVRLKERRELVLLVTPHVLSTPAEGQERSRERLRDLVQGTVPDTGTPAPPADGSKVPLPPPAQQRK